MMNANEIEIGGTYRIAGRSVGGHKGQAFLITAIKDFGERKNVICGRRWIKSTGKFSSKGYQLAYDQPELDGWERVELEAAK